MTPRSWLISTMAALKSALSSRSKSRICAWMVTSSAVVGSSASSSTGSLEKPIASITRWRMPPENWCGKPAIARSGAVIPMRPEQIDRAAAAPTDDRAAVNHHRLDQLIRDAPHRVERGHRVLEHHRDLVAAQRAHVSSLIATMSRSRKTILPLAMRLCSCSSRMIDSAVTLLPEPTRRRCRASRREHLEAHAVDRADHARVGVEIRPQVADVEQRPHRGGRRRVSDAGREGRASHGRHPQGS
jgi:hypothetical protein